MNLNCDESNNLLPLDLCQIATNHLREFVQHRDLSDKVDVSHDSDKSGGGGGSGMQVIKNVRNKCR